MKTYVYIDGFNLYYGALRGTPYKWLDLSKLGRILLPKNTIARIKYYTARVRGRPGDPDQPVRQQIYLRALQTLPNLEIVYGHFLAHEVMMPLAGCPPDAQKYVRVIKTEEKGSDVNIAAYLIHDGYQGKYECAVLISNDSDLLEPVRIVREVLGLPVGIINPYGKHTSRVLSEIASFTKTIRKGVLAGSQFPKQLRDKHGSFSKPPGW